ncbi:hypothetical protein PHLCEN_2v1041 [Hermanssonia centrifuga]|uniref:non-specific serine/threonine protein kinase n=1 Tax=Hermanssonia centrifuga TaxID=98765 RepID=A0A2R6S4F4_9APHY|nr:hypothetical protein PHLCEN_2v1041 [Hermanssonia centrifuga]
MRLKGTLLPFTVVRKYAAELIVAVEEIHRLNIMHRDLKLDNILIDDTGHLVLADFGVAKSFAERPLSRPWESHQSGASTKRQQAGGPREEGLNDTTVTSCGTPGFIAPEVHSKFYSYEADIWSIGVILHYLLLGRVSGAMLLHCCTKFQQITATVTVRHEPRDTVLQRTGSSNEHLGRGIRPRGKDRGTQSKVTSTGA